MAESRNRRSTGWLIALCLLAAFVVAGISLASAWGQEFGGTDAAVTESIEEDGYEPWFQPVFSPGSSELESGLFALQAAGGAGVLGFVLGTLRERRRKQSSEALDPQQPREPAR